jgi:hypothetical protein
VASEGARSGLPVCFFLSRFILIKSVQQFKRHIFEMFGQLSEILTSIVQTGFDFIGFSSSTKIVDAQDSLVLERHPSVLSSSRTWSLEASRRTAWTETI